MLPERDPREICAFPPLHLGRGHLLKHALLDDRCPVGLTGHNEPQCGRNQRDDRGYHYGLGSRRHTCLQWAPTTIRDMVPRSKYSAD